MVWVVQNLLDSENSPWAGKLRDFIDQLKNEDAVTGDKGTAFAQGADDKHMTAYARPGVYAVGDAHKPGVLALGGRGGGGTHGGLFHFAEYPAGASLDARGGEYQTADGASVWLADVELEPYQALMVRR